MQDSYSPIINQSLARFHKLTNDINISSYCWVNNQFQIDRMPEVEPQPIAIVSETAGGSVPQAGSPSQEPAWQIGQSDPENGESGQNGEVELQGFPAGVWSQYVAARTGEVRENAAPQG